jgi:large-conductance mechanosensitive channel
MIDWMMILGWGSPIGTGLFLVLLATMIFVLTKADETSKRSKRENQEKK